MEDKPSEPRTRWARLTGGHAGADYVARLAEIAATGKDMHGEARFCAALLAPGARVLDAGCGTGRVAIRLAELGFDCVGVDVDESMLAEARRAAPDLPWRRADLTTLTPADLEDPQPFDLVVLAGNVIPLLEEGSVPACVRSMTDLLRPGGLLVAGFGLDEQHLPDGCPVTPLADYDAACAAAGLTTVDRFATWDGEPFGATAGYAVSVHRR